MLMVVVKRFMVLVFAVVMVTLLVMENDGESCVGQLMSKVALSHGVTVIIMVIIV